MNIIIDNHLILIRPLLFFDLQSGILFLSTIIFVPEIYAPSHTPVTSFTIIEAPERISEYVTLAL